MRVEDVVGGWCVRVVYVDGECEWCLWYVDVVACCGRWMRLLYVIGGCGWWWWLVDVVGACGW